MYILYLCLAVILDPIIVSSCKTLPIEAIKTDFLKALSENPTLILSAPPGAGKSTGLPLWLLDQTNALLTPFRDKKIYLLQPRRIAAKNIACFLASQLGEPVGQRVGYRLRNDVKVSKTTQLEVITEGILTQIIQHDPELADCGLIILDEFHERSLHADLAFALSRDIQQGFREDLKIVLMSATLASDFLLKELPDAVALSSEGRSFPVEVSYQPAIINRLSASNNRTNNYGNGRANNAWREHALTVILQQANQHQGSILVFLPGVADIHFLVQRLQSNLSENMLLNPLYGELPITQQQQAIAPAPKGYFKLVLATNIAETSLTIEGVDLVIDAGLEKVALYDQQTLTNRLHQQSISKAAAIQRMGRAGRLMPGKCIRLYSQDDFDRRREHNISEIQQADILPLLIESARWGVTSLNGLPLLEFPPLVKETIAWQELALLNIVSDKNLLTAHGKQVAKMPAHPRFAHMIIRAKAIASEKGVKHLAQLACMITALLESRDVFGHESARDDCDLRHRISAVFLKRDKEQQGHKLNYSAVKNITTQAQQLAKSLSLPMNNLSELPLHYTGALLALSYPERISKSRAEYGQFVSCNGKGLSLSTEDVLANEEYLAVAQIFQQHSDLQIRLAAPVELSILVDWNIAEISTCIHVGYDKNKDRIFAKQQERIGTLVISDKVANEKVSEEQIAQLWCEQILNQGLNFLPLQDSSLLLLARWRWVNTYQAQLNLPDASDAALIDALDRWLLPFVGHIKSKTQFKKVDLSALFLNLLTYEQQQQLAKIAPTHFVGPAGRRFPIRYSTEQSPTVSLPMQELYGEKKTPFVGDDRGGNTIPLILELLSPAKRPIQVTQDLVVFWQGSYQAVQKDMKSQYPRHYWPDDPVNAKPTNKVKRLIEGAK